MGDIIFFINEHMILFSIWFIFLILSIFFTVKNVFIHTKIINNTKAIKLINQYNAVVVDARSYESFKKGHIVNSINIPKKYILSGKLKAIEKYKLSPLIFVCDESCRYDEYIKIFLRYGFNHVYILKNGIYSWNLDHLPLITKDN